MPSLESRDIRYPDISAVSHRHRQKTILDRLLPRTVELSEGYRRAEIAVAGGKGLLILYPHLSLRDPIEIMNGIIMKSPVFRMRSILSPGAAHQVNFAVRRYGEYIGAYGRPIVTESSKRHARFARCPINEGADIFYEDAAKVLSLGGIVPVAIQGTRAPVLGTIETNKPTTSTTMLMLARRGIDYIVLFVGIGFRSDDYSSRRGLNLLVPYSVRTGSAYSSGDILKHLRKREIDDFALTNISLLVPEAYKGGETYDIGKFSHVPALS